MELQIEARMKEARRRKDSQMNGGGPSPSSFSENEETVIVFPF